MHGNAENIADRNKQIRAEFRERNLKEPTNSVIDSIGLKHNLQTTQLRRIIFSNKRKPEKSYSVRLNSVHHAELLGLSLRNGVSVKEVADAILEKALSMETIRQHLETTLTKKRR